MTKLIMRGEHAPSHMLIDQWKGDEGHSDWTYSLRSLFLKKAQHAAEALPTRLRTCHSEAERGRGISNTMVREKQWIPHCPPPCSTTTSPVERAVLFVRGSEKLSPTCHKALTQSLPRFYGAQTQA